MRVLINFYIISNKPSVISLRYSASCIASTEWVDWISKYGDDISKRFNKPTSELLEGIVDKIIVSPFIGETREGKDTQRGHIFNIKFKLPIVNDSIEYKDDQNKSEGYSIVKGNKESVVDQEVFFGRPTKKNLTNLSVQPNSFNSN
jgi:hypothetical protein